MADQTSPEKNLDKPYDAKIEQEREEENKNAEADKQALAEQVKLLFLLRYSIEF